MMPDFRSSIRRLVFGLGIMAVLTGTALADTSVSLAPDQLRAAAIAELQTGSANRAKAYADA
ncbi:MAG: hypothetical protein ACI92Z_003765, partial [Paracoccaceae bacterium]